MTENIPKEQIDLLDFIIRSLNTALKNSTLYSSDHPVFELSVRNLKTSLDNWFKLEDELIIGITQTNFLINNKYVRDETGVYTEVAANLHRHGIAAFMVDKGLTSEELTDFLVAIKEKKETMFEKIGLLTHLHVEELDYSVLLGLGTGAISEREEDLWKSLCDVTEQSKIGRLPASREEFLKQFLQDSSRSADLLDKIYKQAVTGVSKVATLDNVRGIIAKIAMYFTGDKTPGARSSRKALADIIAQLDPEFIVKVMGETDVEGKVVDLAKELTRDFSDEMLSDFISSLIASHGGINENLLKVFDKMIPDASHAANISTLAMDNILQRGVDKDTLEQLQLSIKEMVKRQPGNEFVSQLYKRTLDTFAGEQAAAIAKGKLAPLIREFKRSLTKTSAVKDRTKLLLDLIRIEETPADLVKLTDKLAAHFPGILEYGDVDGIKEIFELFKGGLGQVPAGDPANFKAQAGRIMALLNSENTAAKLISLIPEKKELEEEWIAYYFLNCDQKYKKLLIDAFIAEIDPFRRDKFVEVFIKMGRGITDELLMKIGGEDYDVLRSLFRTLRAVDPERARRETIALFRSKDPKIRLEAVHKYLPSTQEEINKLYEMYMREDNVTVRASLLQTLIRVRNWETIDKLFKTMERKRRTKPDLVRLVKACGDNKITESVPDLGKVLFRRIFFNSSATDELKIAAVVSLGQIKTPEAIDMVRKGLGLKREAVKKMCEIVLRMAESVGKTT